MCVSWNGVEGVGEGGEGFGWGCREEVGVERSKRKGRERKRWSLIEMRVGCCCCGRKEHGL